MGSCVCLSNSQAEAIPHAKKRRGGPKNPEKGAAGLKLGRYPFQAGIPHHMKRRVLRLCESTLKEETKKLTYIGKNLEDLKENGQVKTTDPRHMRRDDIMAFVQWMRRKGLDPDSQNKYLKILREYLKTYKNRVIEDMLLDGFEFPKASHKPIRVIEKDDLARIFETVQAMPGYRGVRARGMVSIYFSTGLRPSELRRALRKDIDLANMRIFVRHPKGEFSWGKKEQVNMIRGDVFTMIEEFVKERDEFVKNIGLIDTTLPLFFNPESKDGVYSLNSFNELKRDIEKHAGVEFRLKDFRSTLATMTIEGDLSLLPKVSGQLRHSSPDTTKQFYARCEDGAAGKQLMNEYKKNAIVLRKDSAQTSRVVDTPLIDKKFPPSGYA